MTDRETTDAPSQAPQDIEQRLARIDELAGRLSGIITPGPSDYPGDFSATDDQLAALEAALVASGGYSREHTARLRQEAGEVTRALTRLYNNEAYGNAVPDEVLQRQERDLGSRMFVLDTDTFLALHKALHGGSIADAQQWITDPTHAWGGEMVSEGHVTLLRDPTEYGWSIQRTTAAADSETLYTGRPSDPTSPEAPSLGAVQFAVRAATEEVVHMLLDPTLPVIVQEVIAKVITVDVLTFTGNDHAIDPVSQSCHDYNTQFCIDQRFNIASHPIARIGFGSASIPPNARSRLVDQIIRDAHDDDLLGEAYRDLFPPDDQPGQTEHIE